MNDEITKNMQILDIDVYPFTLESLKENFKALLHIYHPDKQNSETEKKIANEKTIKIITAYKFLLNYANTVNIEEINIEKKEWGMFDFKKECNNCKGTGFFERFEWVSFTICPKCNNTKKIKLKCKYCVDGKFMLRSGRAVDCKACKGTGIWKEVQCNFCNSFSFAFFSKQEQIKKKEKCLFCQGTGKVEHRPINPVIPKGAILK